MDRPESGLWPDRPLARRVQVPLFPLAVGKDQLHDRQPALLLHLAADPHRPQDHGEDG